MPTELVTMTSTTAHGEPYVPTAALEYFYFGVHLNIFIVSLVGNSLAMLSLITADTQLYVWFFNLVSADLLKTIICMPYSLYVMWNFDDYRKFGDLLQPPFCKIEGVVFMVSLLVSLVSNVAIAIDRVVAITAPMYYASLQRAINMPVVVGATWVPVVVFSGLPYAWYKYYPFLPNCSLELHDILHDKGVLVNSGIAVEVLVGSLYSLLFGLPILVVSICCAVVTYKLFKQSSIKQTDPFRQKMPFTDQKETRIMSNSQASGTTYTTQLTVGRQSMDHTTDQPSVVSFVHSRSPSPVTENRSGRIESMNIEEAGRTRLDSTNVYDKMELLHKNLNNNKHGGGYLQRRQKLQKRAGLTMALVALTFFLCHICMFSYWAFYDTDIYTQCTTGGKQQPDSKWSYGVCVTFQTGLITLVYLNAPLNVLIYYYRCSFLRHRMFEFASTFFSAVLSPCKSFAKNLCRG